jgi:hypothetical protein
MSNQHLLDATIWVFASAAVITAITHLLRRRHSVFIFERHAAKIRALVTPGGAPKTSYETLVQNANKKAAVYLAAGLIVVPASIFAVYLFVSGLPHVDSGLLGSVAAVTATSAVLVGVFVAIREVILRLAFTTEKS